MREEYRMAEIREVELLPPPLLPPLPRI
jgi:hypothetical protein